MFLLKEKIAWLSFPFKINNNIVANQNTNNGVKDVVMPQGPFVGQKLKGFCISESRAFVNFFNTIF